jgi:hypothetical protein
LLHLLRTEYWPAHQPWYQGAIWGNLFVVPIAAFLGVLIWPPTRKRIRAFVDRRLAPIHTHLVEAREARERMHAEHMAEHAETQRHLKHIIEHHPDIPELSPPGRVVDRATDVLGWTEEDVAAVMREHGVRKSPAPPTDPSNRS